MARDRYKITENHLPHFITCTAINWLPIFTRPRAVDILLDSLGYLQLNNELMLYGFVIMENHMHMIVESAGLSRNVAVSNPLPHERSSTCCLPGERRERLRS